MVVPFFRTISVPPPSWLVGVFMEPTFTFNAYAILSNNLFFEHIIKYSVHLHLTKRMFCVRFWSFSWRSTSFFPYEFDHICPTVCRYSSRFFYFSFSISLLLSMSYVYICVSAYLVWALRMLWISTESLHLVRPNDTRPNARKTFASI